MNYQWISGSTVSICESLSVTDWPDPGQILKFRSSLVMTPGEEALANKVPPYSYSFIARKQKIAKLFFFYTKDLVF